MFRQWPRVQPARAGPRDRARERIAVSGVVQGVGFRPFVHRLANDLELSGFVGNNDHGVFIEVEGTRHAVAEFRARMVAEPPPLAHIEGVVSVPAALTGQRGFVIVTSQPGDGGSALVSPDLRTCDDCLDELHAPSDRRYRYPFINCTNCGPRFTITERTPYDRPNTTMARFVMCDECRAEYEDPTHRRFHAQPIACSECGPHVWLESRQDHEHIGCDAIDKTRSIIANGGIVAIKGLGGFHLACDARSDEAVARLRSRKGRVDKPFAVMVADLAAARSIVVLGDPDERELVSAQRPIVILPRLAGSGVSDGVAPGNDQIGVMLTYTPLHDLLIEPGDVWVMTSANRSQEPITYTNAGARRLTDLADAILLHDRDIHVPVDDSVVRVVDGTISPVRRSRGFAPFPVTLPVAAPPLLATGGELKATFCLASGKYGFLSQHIGDMENIETLDAFTRAVEHLEGLFRIEPEVLVTDLHPGYLSARWADRVADGRPVIRVQHHHAHIASIMAEHGAIEPVIGFAFDGTGYGPDATIWGGEVLVADYLDYERAFHLRTVPLPGGDTAIRRPYRMALAHLHASGMPWTSGLAPVRACPPEELDVLHTQLEREVNTVPTSSMGRLFDAVSSLIGVRQQANYEGQAAIELEAVVDDSEIGRYEFDVEAGVLDPSPVLEAIIADLDRGLAASVISSRFHSSVAHMMVACAEAVRTETGIGTVGLSGGVFQNATLTTAARHRLEQRGFRVLTHRQVPPNDAGLSLGQTVIAAMKAR